jgi:hypothetical protein
MTPTGGRLAANPGPTCRAMKPNAPANFWKLATGV